MKPGAADHAFEQEAACTMTGELGFIVQKSWGRAMYVKNNKVSISGYEPFLVENVIVYFTDEANYQIGNKITVSGKIFKFTEATNPGQFNEYMYYKIQNITYKVRADEIHIIDADYSFFHNFLEEIKRGFLKVYEIVLPEKEAGAIIAMLLGEKYLLDEEINELYQENGISHILAISGLHISLIGAAVYGLFRKLKTGLIPATLISIIIVICYGVLTNFTVSTNRAVVMFFLMLIARILGKTYDMMSALSLSAFLILLQNPLQIFSAGFLLSFGAVMGLAVILPCLKGRFQKLNPLVDGILVSISAQIMTLPLIMIFFYGIPVYSLFINLLILPSSSVLILSALIAGILGLFYLPLGVFAIGGTNYILKFYEFLCRFASDLPGNIYTTGKPETIRIIVFLLLLILFLWGSQRFMKRRWLIVLISSLVVLIAPIENMPLLKTLLSNDGLTVTMLDVGQGDGIYIKSSRGTTYLIDGGSGNVSKVGKNRIQPFLLYHGVDRIDYAIVTHCDQDHISGLVELMEGSRIKIKNLVLPLISIDEEIRELFRSNREVHKGREIFVTEIDKYAVAYLELEARAHQYGIPVLYISKGDMIQEGELIFRCHHPAEGFLYSSANSYSTVLSVTYGNFDMLLTGDLEQGGEELLMEEMRRGELGDMDILKVAHHGSKYSTSDRFLETIQPELSLISCGKNNFYGHPHEELLDRLDDVGSEVVKTYESGAITIKTDGKRMMVEKYME